MANLTEDVLSALAPKIAPGATGVADLRRLTGGAVQETWAFTLKTPARALPIVLRRAANPDRTNTMTVPMETEATLMRLAGGGGVPSPHVRYVLTPEDDLGSGFFMDHVEGEALGGRIVRDPAFADVRPKLARQCGEIIARLHSIPRAGLPPLQTIGAAETIADLEASHRHEQWPRPVFELAFRWLKARLPKEAERITLVHGDFRNGNLLIGADGVRAVLDWELAHLGDPMQDLGWMCVNSWRFGAIDKPVGGFGAREDMYAGYEAAGGVKVDPERVRFWEALGVLRWGVMCTFSTVTLKGPGPFTVDRPMIARRASECELDLLDIMEGAR